MRRHLLAAFAATSFAAGSPALAHDFWLQPSQFAAAPGQDVSFVLLAGHGAERQRSRLTRPRILRLVDAMEGEGPKDLTPRLSLGDAFDGTVSLPKAGLHVLVLETDNRGQSHQPAARYNAYLRDEGLTAVMQARQRQHLTDADGSERYSRAAKALVQVGAPGEGPQGAATRPVGLKLEIVPEVDPYAAVRPTSLPVRVLYRGRPLAGALIKLTDLDRDAQPMETHRTDRAGRARFALPDRGRWMLDVVWSTPAPKDWDTDFETVFSSLSFGFPPIAKESDSGAPPSGAISPPEPRGGAFR